MYAVPLMIEYLYFPLVIPGEQIIAFKAARDSSGIHIDSDLIELI